METLSLFIHTSYLVAIGVGTLLIGTFVGLFLWNRTHPEE